jgi:PAS domain S-box-containing protein
MNNDQLILSDSSANLVSSPDLSPNYELSERYKFLFENAPIGIITIDLEGRIIEINPKMVEILGSPSMRDTLQINVLTFSPLVKAGIAEDILNCLQTGRNYVAERPYVTKWGKAVYLRYHLTSIRDQHEVLIGVEAVVEDITDRKETERHLKDSEAKYRKLIETANDAIFLADVETGIILDVNKKAEKLMGISAKELIGTHQSRLHPSAERDYYRQLFKRHAKKGNAITEDMYIINAAGEKVPVEISASLTEMDGRKILQGCFRNTLDRKKAEAEINYRLEFEKVIMSVAARFVQLRAGELDRGFSEALQTIGEFCQVDRSYIFLFDRELTEMNNIHEWCAPGVAPKLNILQHFSVRNLPWFFDKLKRMEVFYMPRVQDLPPEAQMEKTRFTEQKIISLVVVPMAKQGKLIGFLGFDSEKEAKKWDKNSIALLKITGVIFVNALDRKQAKEQLAESDALNQMLLQSIPFPMLIVNENDQILFENAGMRLLMAQKEQEKNVWWQILQDNKQSLYRTLKDDIKIGETETFELNNILGGRTFQVSLTGLKYQGKKAILEIFVDITDRKNAEIKLIGSYRHLALVNRQVSILLNLNRYTQNKSAEEKANFIINSATRLGRARFGVLYQVKRGNLGLMASYGLTAEESAKIKTIVIDDYLFFQDLINKRACVQGSVAEYNLADFNIRGRIMSFIILPLFEGQEIHGIIFVGVEDRANLTTQEFDFYKVFALEAQDVLFELSSSMVNL